MTLDLAPADHLRLVEMLATGKSIAVAGVMCDIDLDAAGEIAKTYGFPDQDALLGAAEGLRRAVNGAGSAASMPVETPRRAQPPPPRPKPKGEPVDDSLVKDLTSRPQRVPKSAAPVPESPPPVPESPAPVPAPEPVPIPESESYDDVTDPGVKAALASDDPTIREQAEKAADALRSLKAALSREADLALARAEVNRCRDVYTDAQHALAEAEGALAALNPPRRSKGKRPRTLPSSPGTETCPYSGCEAGGLRGRQGISMHMWRVHGLRLTEWESAHA